MTIQKTANGYLRISDIVNGVLFTRLYIGYTRKEATKLFNEDKRKA